MAERVFVRGLEGDKYNLKAHRRERLAAPHVIHEYEQEWKGVRAGWEGNSPESRAKWMMAPSAEPFLTQTIQSHFVEIAPGGANGGHGHQNEAAFFILEGQGHEIHDTERYEWQTGDLVVVHNDSRHQHFNDSTEARVLALVLKTKSLFLFLGLTQQGSVTTIPEGEEDRFGPREDWSGLWTAGLETKRKVVKGDQEPWQVTRDGTVKWMANRDMDVRLNSVDVWQQRIEEGSRSARHWHMADEICYVIEGAGYTLEWEVEADIDDRYYARVAREPRRNEWAAGDMVYVPQNTVHQHFATGSSARMVCAQNRVFKMVGYDAVHYLEDAPEWAASHAANGRTVTTAVGI